VIANSLEGIIASRRETGQGRVPVMLALFPAKESGEGAVAQGVDGSGPVELPEYAEWTREGETRRRALAAKRNQRCEAERSAQNLDVGNPSGLDDVKQEIKTHTRDRVLAKRKINVGARTALVQINVSEK
jgi:hypothetical protein